MNSYYVYILASQRNGTIYIGVTNDLERRIQEHKAGGVEGFTKQYGVKILVYYETTDSIGAAIAREKQLKDRSRSYKLNLIEKSNPQWKDLSSAWRDDPGSPRSTSR